MKTNLRKTLAVLCALCLGSCTGCSRTVSAAPADQATTAVCFVIQNSANGPRLGTAEAATLTQYAAFDAGDSVSIVVADGDPDLYGPIVYTDTAKNKVQRQKTLAGYGSDLQNALTATVPDEDEIDLLEALSLGARTLNAAASADKRLVLAGPALNTCQPLAMQELDGFFDSDPADIVGQLADQKRLPALDGVEVLWFYSGDFAGTQEALSPAQVAFLQDFWTRLLTASGASSVEFRAEVATGTADTGTVRVSPVAVRSDAISVAQTLEAGQTVALDEETLAFLPDSCAFRDEDAAREQLAGIAEVIRALPDQTFVLAGSTADVAGSLEKTQTFALARARAVRDVLLAEGVQPGQLVCVGLGKADWSRRQTDAAANRAVWLIPGTQQELVREVLETGLGESASPD